MTIAGWCVLAAFILAYLPRVGSIRGAIAMDGAYDNLDPRAQQARLKGHAARSQATHQNALESLAPFIGGVWAAHAFGADPMWRDGLALLYIAARLIYWRAYVKEWGNGRSLVWFVSILAIIGLYVVAGV